MNDLPLQPVQLEKYIFGLAPARIGFPAQFPEMDNLYKIPFSAVLVHSETPASCLNEFKHRNMMLCSGPFIEPEISRNILSAQSTIQTQFVETMRQKIIHLSDAGYASAVFDPGLDIVLDNDGSAYKAISLLRQIAPVLERTGFTLLLPLPVPFRGKLTAKRLSTFLQALMLPWFRVQLEVYPHELSRGFSPEALAGAVALETRSVLFVYDADSGSTLIPDHIRPWLDWFSVFGFSGPYFSAPLSSGGFRFQAETDKFIRLLNVLANKEI